MREISFEIRIPKILLSEEWKRKLQIIFSASIITGVFLVGKIFDLTFAGTLILVYLGIALLWNLTSRIAASLALFFLASCPILLFMKSDALAETFAIYAYYLLIITVIQEIAVLNKK